MGIGVFAFFIILYLLLRETPSSYLKKAIKHHKIGESFSQKGEFEEAKIHYAIAQEYRERALKKGEK